jgi:hypothetical protein
MLNDLFKSMPEFILRADYLEGLQLMQTQAVEFDRKIGELTAERDALIKLVDANQAQTFDVMRGVVICLSSISRVLKEGQGPLSVAAAVDKVVAEFQDGIDNSKIVTIRKT